MKKTYRIFLLSPAKAGGRKSEILLNPRASFDLARKLQKNEASLGEVFSFLSGLYFRGKLVYANQFSVPYKKIPAVWVITSDRGLLPASTTVTVDDLIAFGDVPIDPSEKRYTEALERTAFDLLKQLPRNCEFILLGSISTKKYVELLIKIFGERLKFPPSFVGRGDMSRGGLLLRSAAAGVELEYVSLHGAARHGKRPPKLGPKPR